MICFGFSFFFLGFFHCGFAASLAGS